MEGPKMSRVHEYRRRLNILFVAVTLGPAMIGFAKPVAADTVNVVPAEEARREAHVVNKGITWHTSLAEAQSEARKQGKLVFWMHMLGTIDGAT
jgi:hypothetical protein